MTFHIGHMCVTSFQPEYVTSLWEMLIGQISSHKGCSFSSCQHLLMHSFSYKYVFESILLITFPFVSRSAVNLTSLVFKKSSKFELQLCFNVNILPGEGGLQAVGDKLAVKQGLSTPQVKLLSHTIRSWKC